MELRATSELVSIGSNCSFGPASIRSVHTPYIIKICHVTHLKTKNKYSVKAKRRGEMLG